MNDNAKDFIRNVLIGSSASIPYVGGSISYYLDKAAPDFAESQYNELLSKLETEIEKIKEEINPRFVDSPEFVTLCTKAAKKAIFEYHDIKKQAYRNIIITAMTEPLDFQMTDFFLRLTDELTEAQFEVLLCAYYADRNYSKAISISHYIQEYNEQAMFIMSITSELSRLRLLTGGITDLGKKYCGFINCPTSLFPIIIKKYEKHI